MIPIEEYLYKPVDTKEIIEDPQLQDAVKKPYGSYQKFGFMSEKDPRCTQLTSSAQSLIHQAVTMQLNLTSPDAIYMYAVNSQCLLNKDLELLKLSTTEVDQKKLTLSLTSNQFEAKLKNASINSAPLNFSSARAPKTALEHLSEDPLWGYKVDKVHQNMAMAQMGNAIDEVISAWLQEVKKSVEQHVQMFDSGPFKRKQNPRVAEMGKAIYSYIAENCRELYDKTPIPELIEKAHALYLRSQDGHAMANELERQFDIPQELGLEYEKNFSGVLHNFVPYGTLGIVASSSFKAVRPLAKQMVEGARTSLGRATLSEAEHIVSPIIQGPKTPLSGPSPGFQVFVQAENNIQEKLSQPYRNFKVSITANRHPKVLYSEVPRHPDVYFHATSFERACGILKSSSIKRFDRSYFLGAFVSTRPEFSLGDIVLAFNRSIEKVGEVLNSDFVSGRYWVGFSKSIPVTSESLEYIAVKADLLAHEPIESLAKQLSAAAGREIPVFPLEPIIEIVEKRAIQEGIFVPDEWPVFKRVTH